MPMKLSILDGHQVSYKSVFPVCLNYEQKGGFLDTLRMSLTSGSDGEQYLRVRYPSIIHRRRPGEDS